MNEEFEKLISDFESIPILDFESTYLELCKYPYNRFEEICSRLLAYFFNPSNNHGLKDLFLSSFFNLININKESEHQYKYNLKNEVIVKKEVYANGKRLDLLLTAHDFIIGIENKISANLYNPLEDYNNLITQYNKKFTYKIVLSIKPITDKNEIHQMSKFEFLNVLYVDLFREIKSQIGFYLQKANNKSLFILNDFLNTIENMSNNNNMEEDDNFFILNKVKIEQLIHSNDVFKKKLENLRYGFLKDLQSSLLEKTGVNWFLFEDWDLGYGDFCKEYKIGIESHYELTTDSKKSAYENALGHYYIFITAWDRISWDKFYPSVRELYPNILVEEPDNNRPYMRIKTIKNNNIEEILTTLISCFNNLKNITKEYN